MLLVKKSITRILFFSVLYFKFKEVSGKLRMKVNKWLIVISVVIIIVPTIIMVTNVINAFNSAETARGKAMKALEKIESSETIPENSNF
ncbi:hypothetical protein A2995_00750 [Candidatus Nomurabacteria bacterium RIFCSPLOWO2_01_FULL_33_24]|uniref:Uncharacterized protein n=1 Tax=Candidatus Nomurabacteria bacterium RIFCSPLOWO2_01_FULL_33_24 TaxID=1801765 RepID=A0A1F6X1K2_9BACT|nr:MAG: hypothetical protein A2995_00750 [Candidatus Nomurabacteria bacterium RIFCSPLOWO2_01_FULL_33_24]